MNIMEVESKMEEMYSYVTEYSHFTENSVTDITKVAKRAIKIAEEHIRREEAITQLESAISWEKEYLPLRGLTKEEERQAILKSIRLTRFGIGLWLGRD